jgi:hypothetical protein
MLFGHCIIFALKIVSEFLTKQFVFLNFNILILFFPKAKRYCEMLLKINGNKIIENIYEKSKADNDCKFTSLCKQLLDIFDKYTQNSFKDC